MNMDIAGKWSIALDCADRGQEEGWYLGKLDGAI